MGNIFGVIEKGIERIKKKFLRELGRDLEVRMIVGSWKVEDKEIKKIVEEEDEEFERKGKKSKLIIVERIEKEGGIGGNVEKKEKGFGEVELKIEIELKEMEMREDMDREIKGIEKSKSGEREEMIDIDGVFWKKIEEKRKMRIVVGFSMLRMRMGRLSRLIGNGDIMKMKRKNDMESRK